MNTLSQVMSQLQLGMDMNILFDMRKSTESLDSLDNSPYQAEIIFNKILPYADKIDDEADGFLAKIKANFGRCVMLRDINPGCAYWSDMLTKYIVLYGLRFTKDEHIIFIKLTYELILIPNLQPTLVDTFCKLLIALLQKKETLSPNELQLPWEPLYKLCDKVLYRMEKEITLYKYPDNFKNTLEKLVASTKIYFPLNATQEILDELRPKLCPFDIGTMCKTIKLFHWFLPVELAVEHHAIGHKLWLNEFMDLWEVCHNVPMWENDMMNLMANLATNNIGYIDWNPYIPVMFTRFVRSLQLPVYYKKISYDRHYNIDPSAAGEWIVSVLGNNSNAQMYLDKFLKSIETYFHPANVGKWLRRLLQLIVEIAYSFIKRLHRERYAKKSWAVPIPESHKLTEKNIDEFVNSMMPVVIVGVHNYFCSVNSCVALQYLALIRPNLVIPAVFEKLYPALGTDIEEHKLNTVMNCMTHISRPLVLGSRYTHREYAFPEGPTHVLPLLFSCLNGIDLNDPSKCFKTLGLINTYITLVPIVDCSSSKVEKTEDEHIICEDTARFEDFVLQFMDKIFRLIGSSSLELVRLENLSNDGDQSTLEKMAVHGLHNVFTTVLLQTSDAIFVSILNKLRSFILLNTLETKISGQLLAVLCKACSKTNSKMTLRSLLPLFADKILEIIGEGEDVVHEENLDNELLYYLLLMQKMVETQGDALLPYIDSIIKVLDQVMLLKSREGSQLACGMLNNVLYSLCTVQPIRLDKNLDDPEYPYWNDWGESVDILSSRIRWYIPGEQEMTCAQTIFKRYFIPAITLIEDYVNSKKLLSRDEIQRLLRVINSIIDGCDYVLPVWSEPPITSLLYERCITTFNPIIGNNHVINMPDGSNVRRFLVQTMTALQNLMLQNVEDDTKSLMLLLQIWNKLSMNKRMLPHEAGINRRGFHLKKKVLKDTFTGNKGYLPSILWSRMSIEHTIRKTNNVYMFTQTVKDIMLNLFQLSISQYSKVRITAQRYLCGILSNFTDAYRTLIPCIIEVLAKDTELHHDAYKGVLYLIVQKFGYSLILNGDRPDWQVLSQLLPALVLAKPSEKLSIIRQQNTIVSFIIKNFTFTNIKLDVPDSCVLIASQLWNSGVQPESPLPTKEEVNKGVKSLLELGQNNLKVYNEILNKLTCAIDEKNLHWRHRHMAMHFISCLVHPDQILPASVVRHFINALINDNIHERKLAWTMTAYILNQLKKKQPKRVLEIENRNETLQPGFRTDNAWLQYKYENRPTTKEQWEQPRYIHKNYVGYYSWSKKVEIYDLKSSELDKRSGLSDQEKEIEKFFSVEQNIEKLMNFLTLEEKKGKDSFNYDRYLLFKGLFCNHGDKYMLSLLPRLREMVQTKQESVQRCAAEIICGLVRGSKHWPFAETHQMWQELLPIVRLALANVTEETLGDWIICFSLIFSNRDPSRLHWLLECLVEESLRGQSEASFLECARLEMLLAAVEPSIWRLSEIITRLLPQLESRLLQSPFNNIRDVLAKFFAAIFSSNLKFPNREKDGKKLEYPELEDFVNRIKPRLELLLNAEDSKSPAYVESARLLNTVCKCIAQIVGKSLSGVTSSIYELYPIISYMENCETEEEVSIQCKCALAILAPAPILMEHLPSALKSVELVCKSSSWSSRTSGLQFLQILLFHNMSTLLSDREWIDRIRKIVLHLLQDERLEVKESSAQILTGMLHCTLLPDEQATLEEFKRLAGTKLRSKKNPSPSEIHLRHAGVLGMCAFIQAHPYDLPKDIPPIFNYLNLNISDPEPIPTTIKKTVSDFKRTHCDGWIGLQGLAQDLTEEQFELLQNLTVPPTYYA